MINKKTLLFAFGALWIAAPALGDTGCKYKGTAFSHGSAVCQSGSQYRCDDGIWTGLAIACKDGPVAGRSCAFDGSWFSPGAASCQSGMQYRCDDGSWQSLAVTCTTSGAEVPIRRAAAGRTCMYNGATVATESTICKAGITFRCEDGEWRNLGSACQ